MLAYNIIGPFPGSRDHCRLLAMTLLLCARPLQAAVAPDILRAPARALLPSPATASSRLSKFPLCDLPLSQASFRRSSCSRMAGTAPASDATEQSIYNFTVKDIDGKDVSLSFFKGKVLLIVNVASRCGLTTSNYSGLAELYSKLKNEGFEILAFPCNQFGGQEPGTNQQIKEFACSRFKAEYPIFDKVDVNGENTAPVYKFLKSSKSTGLLGTLFGDNIKWNFEKFLVDKNGCVVQRYEPTTLPSKIENDVKKLLEA